MHGARPERHRINYLVRRDRYEAARAWIERTLKLYREAVSKPGSHASNAKYRPLFEQAIGEFEEWLASQEQLGMPETNSNGLASVVRQATHPLTGAADDYDPLLDLIGEARYVLLGEASHGTHEFYRERAQITKRLIKEKGFRAVAVEADWPDAYRVNRYVRGFAEDEEGVNALEGFKRFPTWMVAQRRCAGFHRVITRAQRGAQRQCPEGWVLWAGSL
jgi:hypothetical protein